VLGRLCLPFTLGASIVATRSRWAEQITSRARSRSRSTSLWVRPLVGSGLPATTRTWPAWIARRPGGQIRPVPWMATGTTEQRDPEQLAHGQHPQRHRQHPQLHNRVQAGLVIGHDHAGVGRAEVFEAVDAHPHPR
jgi:hypothetical protein